jgi:hypothetical protein
VDDGSDEETRKYLSSVSSPKVRVSWLAHSGNPSHVRNIAIRTASGAIWRSWTPTIFGRLPSSRS